MQKETKYLIASGLSLGALSIVYFFSLVWGLSFFIAIGLSVIAAGGIWWWVLKGSGSSVAYNVEQQVWAMLIMAAGLYFIVVNSDVLSLNYGGWDAWVMWDLYAKYMAGGHEQWRYIFLNTTGHADYPLLVPGIVGFFLRIFNSVPVHVVSYIFCSVIMFFIPLLVFFETLKKNIIVAGLALFAFAFDVAYLQESVLHYADIPLAFFFLSALICVDNAKLNPKYVGIAAACLGCSLWTKNEGLVLSAILVVFNARVFLSRKNIKYTIAGIAIPLITLFVFKIGYATSNDMVGAFASKGLNKIFDGSRYVYIFRRFYMEMATKFVMLKVVLLSYISFGIVQRKWPDRRFNMLLFCMLVYLLIYVFSPYDLKWHMDTSVNRLIIHLVPAVFYVVAQRLADVKIVLPE